jgi:hypothetical protein
MRSSDLKLAAVAHMLQTKMAPPSEVLRPYVWAYGMTTGQVGSVPLVIPLPARPKQLLTFFFEETYRIRRPDSGHSDASPRVTVVGPQTHAGAGLSVCGRINNFTIHFQPSGFNRLFGIPMTELTDAAYDAYAVIGPCMPNLEHELGDTSGLTVDQSKTLLGESPSGSLRGKRDRAILALLIGCGLRRAELVGLETEDFQIREEHCVIADLIGKGKHIRTVPVPRWAKRAVDEWTTAAGINTGAIFRRVSRLDKIWGDSITPKAIWHVVKAAAKRADIKNLAPHDLRRTCARLCPSGRRT